MNPPGVYQRRNHPTSAYGIVSVMSIRKALYIGLSLIAPLAIIAASYCLIRAVFGTSLSGTLWYRSAFYSFFIVSICIEGRVRLGYRLQRTRLFWIHLSCAVPFFLLLGALAFIPMPLWVGYIELILFTVVLGTGSILFHRGLRKEL